MDCFFRLVFIQTYKKARIPQEFVPFILFFCFMLFIKLITARIRFIITKNAPSVSRK